MKSKSTLTVILFYAMAGMLMISIHHNIDYGFAASYPFYMITLVLFLGYTYRRMNEPNEEEAKETSEKGGVKTTFNKKTK